MWGSGANFFSQLFVSLYPFPILSVEKLYTGSYTYHAPYSVPIELLVQLQDTPILFVLEVHNVVTNVIYFWVT